MKEPSEISQFSQRVGKKTTTRKENVTGYITKSRFSSKWTNETDYLKSQ